MIRNLFLSASAWMVLCGTGVLDTQAQCTVLMGALGGVGIYQASKAK